MAYCLEMCVVKTYVLDPQGFLSDEGHESLIKHTNSMNHVPITDRTNTTTYTSLDQQTRMKDLDFRRFRI